MGASIDLRKAHLVRQHGDLTAVYSWLNDERAMFLIPSARKQAPWYVLCESAAYTWAEGDGEASPQAIARKGSKVCEVLGIDSSPTNVRRVIGIILDGLPDLIRMPSSPPKEQHRQSFGQMILRADGQEIAGQDIRLDKDVAEYA